MTEESITSEVETNSEKLNVEETKVETTSEKLNVEETKVETKNDAVIPKAVVRRIVKQTIAPTTKISSGAETKFVEAAVNRIKELAQESEKNTLKAKRKTIFPEDIPS